MRFFFESLAKSTKPIRFKASLNAELSYLHCSSKHHGPLCYNSAIRFLYRNEILLSLECSVSSACSSANSIDVKCTLRWHQETSLDHLQHPPNSLFPSPSPPPSLSLFSLSHNKCRPPSCNCPFSHDELCNHQKLENLTQFDFVHAIFKLIFSSGATVYMM